MGDPVRTPPGTRIRKRIDADENRSAAGRRLELAGVELLAIRPDSVRHLCGAATYLSLPFDRVVIPVFAAVTAGARTRGHGDSRSAGLVLMGGFAMRREVLGSSNFARLDTGCVTLYRHFDPGVALRDSAAGGLAAERR